MMQDNFPVCNGCDFGNRANPSALFLCFIRVLSYFNPVDLIHESSLAVTQLHISAKTTSSKYIFGCHVYVARARQIAA